MIGEAIALHGDIYGTSVIFSTSDAELPGEGARTILVVVVCTISIWAAHVTDTLHCSASVGSKVDRRVSSAGVVEQSGESLAVRKGSSWNSCLSLESEKSDRCTSR